MSAEQQVDTQAADSLSDEASRHTLALNPLVGLRGKDLFDSVGILVKAMVNEPRVAIAQWLSFLGELTDIVGGKSERAPVPGDKRFNDPTWTNSRLHNRLLKAYLAWGAAVENFIAQSSLSAVDKQRASLMTTIMIDAFAPTNTLIANPAAMRKLLDTGGESLWKGLKNYVEDLLKNGGLPSQVDTSAFKVGQNLATTPGSVIFHNELIELIQYTPTTPTVRQRPLVITPPQINKYYATDLSPDKSLVRFLLDGGIQTFAVSWRNPTVEHRDWGLDTYVAALDKAVDAVRDITRTDDISMMGSCSGGITSVAYLAVHGAAKEQKIRNLVLAVCMLDTSAVGDTTFGSLITPETMHAAKAASRLRGVLDGHDLARMFAWMRPNDLIWNYWVNNYLLGNAPPAFDVLYWNYDTTRLPARLHADFLDLIDANPFVNAGTLAVRGTPLDMTRVNLDSYVVAGQTDHITPWQGCYNTARLYGERSTFVLANSGHIQSLLNPPGNPKACFWSGAASAANAEAWREQAAKHGGSWWPHWLDWIKARSGETRPAPAAPGSAENPPLEAAPGRYVMER